MSNVGLFFRLMGAELAAPCCCLLFSLLPKKGKNVALAPLKGTCLHNPGEAAQPHGGGAWFLGVHLYLTWTPSINKTEGQHAHHSLHSASRTLKPWVR